MNPPDAWLEPKGVQVLAGLALSMQESQLSVTYSSHDNHARSVLKCVEERCDWSWATRARTASACRRALRRLRPMSQRSGFGVRRVEVLGQHIEDPASGSLALGPLLQRFAEAAFPRPQEDVADQQGLHIVREMLRR